MVIKEFVFVWYRTQDDFEKIKIISIDTHNLDDSFEQWLKSAETGIKELSERGYIVRKINVNPDELFIWCRDKGLKINAKARSDFAVWTHNQRSKS